MPCEAKEAECGQKGRATFQGVENSFFCFRQRRGQPRRVDPVEPRAVQDIHCGPKGQPEMSDRITALVCLKWPHLRWTHFSEV